MNEVEVSICMSILLQRLIHKLISNQGLFTNHTRNYITIMLYLLTIKLFSYDILWKRCFNNETRANY